MTSESENKTPYKDFTNKYFEIALLEDKIQEYLDAGDRLPKMAEKLLSILPANVQVLVISKDIIVERNTDNELDPEVWNLEKVHEYLELESKKFADYDNELQSLEPPYLQYALHEQEQYRKELKMYYKELLECLQ